MIGPPLKVRSIIHYRKSRMSPFSLRKSRMSPFSLPVPTSRRTSSIDSILSKYLSPTMSFSQTSSRFGAPMTNVIREIASQRKCNYSSYSSHPANCESRAEQYWTWSIFGTRFAKGKVRPAPSFPQRYLQREVFRAGGPTVYLAQPFGLGHGLCDNPLPSFRRENDVQPDLIHPQAFSLV